ncbi:MAG: hypothetical protein ACOYL6_03380 [Bacteriovoracaceae bacterium]
MLLRKFALLIFFLSSFASAETICNHGPPQRLGFEPPPAIVKLNYIKENSPISPMGNLKQLNNQFVFKSLLINGTPKTYLRRMKILILSASNDEALEPTITLAKKVLNNYGIQYEHHFIVENKIKTKTLPRLINEFGQALYYGIILSTGQLAYANAEGLFQSALTPDEWNTFHQFSVDFKIRTVSLYTYPNPTIGFENSPLENPGKTVQLLPTDTFKKFDAAYPKNVYFDLIGSWAYAGKLTNTKLAKPLVYYNDFLDNEGKPAVASALIHFEDNREEIHFFFSQSFMFTSSTALSSGWINWLTQNIYIGKRRIILNAHIDDVFLSTGLYSKYDDPSVEGPNPDKFVYRLTADDLEYYTQQQEKEIRPLAKNPEFRLDMAFNGNGIMEHGGYAQDSLLRKAHERLNDFYWLTHTFTHGDLNWLTYKSSKWEFTTNILVAEDFIKNQKQLFSANSIVTPRISGLFNPGALKAMDEVGLKYCVGDNTRDELVPNNIHHGLYTTKDFNGYAGIYIVPRYATEIYYNTSKPDELADEYNLIYNKYFGRDSTPEEIFSREKLRVVKQLLSYEYSPYMFHQANLRSWASTSGKRESLVGYWIKNVLSELRRYSTLPVLSEKMDVLAPMYQAREALDNCEAEVWQETDLTYVKSLKVNTKNSCSLWITVPSRAVIESWKGETYGTDQTYEKKFTSGQLSVYKVQN